MDRHIVNNICRILRKQFDSLNILNKGYYIKGFNKYGLSFVIHGYGLKSEPFEVKIIKYAHHNSDYFEYNKQFYDYKEFEDYIKNQLKTDLIMLDL